MSKVDYPRVLKQLRTENQLSVKQLSAYLSEDVKPISIKTIYGWEQGVSKPDSDMLISLCQIYGVSDLRALTDDVVRKDATKESMYFLTPKEWSLIQAYRNMPQYGLTVRKIYDLEE